MAFKPCCCISSKTGAIMIATFDIILCVLGTIYVLLGYVGLSYIQSLPDPVMKEHFMQEMRKSLNEQPEYKNLDDEAIFSMMHVLYSSVLVACSIVLVMDSILVHGIRKERPTFIKAYLIFYPIIFGLGLIITIYYLIKMASLQYTLFTLSWYSMEFYFLIVVYHAYLEVKNNTSQSQNPAA